MRCLGRLIGLGLVLVFVTVLPCSIWTFNTQRIALDGSTYQRIFSSQDFYDDLVPEVLPALLGGLETEAATSNEVTLLGAIRHVDRDIWDDQIAPTLVPVTWVESEVERNLDSFLAWLDADEDLVIVFRTEPLRRYLAGPPGDMAVQQMAQALPACTADQEAQFETYLDQPDETAFPYCRPARHELAESLVSLLQDARAGAVAQLPQELDVLEAMREEARQETTRQDGSTADTEDVFSERELNNFRSGVQLWERLLPLTLMIPLAILSVVVIVVIRSGKAFFRWTGWALILANLLTLFPLFFLPFLMPELDYKNRLQGGFASGGELIAEIVSSRALRLLIGAFTWPILTQATVMIGAGFVFVVISVLLREPDTLEPALMAAGPSISTVPTPPALPAAPDTTPTPARTPPPDDRSKPT